MKSILDKRLIRFIDLEVPDCLVAFEEEKTELHFPIVEKSGFEIEIKTHSENVACTAYSFGQYLGLSNAENKELYLSGLLHDIGKVGIPEVILQKSGRLSKKEYQYVKMHSRIGANILKITPGLENLSKTILYHHERYDGLGYPTELEGEKIPVFSRLIALCDAFDAMISTRSYQDSRSIEAACEEILLCSGKQFDPYLAKEFTEYVYTFDSINLEEA